MPNLDKLIERRIEQIGEYFKEQNRRLEQAALETLKELKEKGTIRYDAPYQMDKPPTKNSAQTTDNKYFTPSI